MVEIRVCQRLFLDGARFATWRENAALSSEVIFGNITFGLKAKDIPGNNVTDGLMGRRLVVESFDLSKTREMLELALQIFSRALMRLKKFRFLFIAFGDPVTPQSKKVVPLKFQSVGEVSTSILTNTNFDSRQLIV